MSKLEVEIEGHFFQVEVSWTPQDGQKIRVLVDGVPATVTIPDQDQAFDNIQWLIVDDRPYELVFDHDLHWIKIFSGLHRLDVRDLEAMVSFPRHSDGRVKAPIPGLVTQILAAVGAEIRQGQPIIVLEAMKMENEIRAPRSGILESISVSIRDSVVSDQLLATIS